MSSRERAGRSESVFNQFSAAIKGFIVKQSYSAIEAEDLLQDVFYKFIVADGEEQLIQNISSWLYRVTRNLIIDGSRKIKEEKMPQIDLSDGDELLSYALSELMADDGNYQSDPERSLNDAILKEELEIALAKLPKEQRAVFELNEIQGFSFKEISQSCGIPINTLISRKRYAIQSLRRELSQIYQDI